MSTVTRPAKTENEIRAESTRFARAENESEPRIDREGGRYESGIIRDVALITPGEALGHGVWIDATFLGVNPLCQAGSSTSDPVVPDSTNETNETNESGETDEADQ